MDHPFVGLDVAKKHLDGHVRPTGEDFVALTATRHNPALGRLP
jgi:hypothetical protein